MNRARLVVSVPSARLREALGEVPGGVEVVKWDMSGPSQLDEIDIVVPPYMATVSPLTQLATVKTRLVQSQSDGYDGVERLLPPGHVFANAASVHESATSELALALILASQRGIPDFVRAAADGRWAPAPQPGLADHSVLLVGCGGVGRAIEARLLAFETTVVRVARTARVDERGSIHAAASLATLLPDADIVVVSVPLTEATTRLIDDSFLSRMRDGSLLVNIARGPVADTEALVRHARSGRLRLALDVTDPEPLPDGHPLFGLANVLISPHVGGTTTAMMPRMARLLHEQIARMLRGDDPLNVVLRS
jgi:phosphoglycerate dehydrogenase-like enzyme